MPIGFILLGLILIYELFFEKQLLFKVFSLIFCSFTMLGYVVKPLYLDNLSVNIIICVSALILMCYFAKNFNKSEKINLLIYGTIVAISYTIITIINSDFISVLNPYPILFVIILLGVFSISNISFVISFSMFSFLILNLCNLFVERGLGYVNFASVELFNLILVVLAVLVSCRFLMFELKFLKKDEIWKNFYYYFC